ncbi:MAG: hypothetical protein SW833_03890 [Cyanobacteriota bacterium]|nr:hypothetical protein [Cyanobacteriota bacterium]
MVLKDEFKKAIQAGNLNEALALAMSRATELNITTWVAPENGETSSTPQPGNRLRARIDLLQGKIENEVGDRFIGYGPYRELRDFHAAQVARSPALVRANLQSLQKLFGALNALQQQKQHLAARDAGLPTLELSPLPQLVSSQPDSSPQTSVIPSLEPLAPLPNLEKPSPAPENPPPAPENPPPAPVLPVSELEIEDWEEAVGGSPSPVFPPPRAEELESETPSSNEREWNEEGEREPEVAIASSIPDASAVDDSWSGFRAISGEAPPVESLPEEPVASASLPEEHWSQSWEEPSQSRVEEVFFGQDDWGEPGGELAVSAVAPLNTEGDGAPDPQFEESSTAFSTQPNTLAAENFSDAEDWGDLTEVESPVSVTPDTFIEESEEWSEFEPQEDLGTSLTEPLEQGEIVEVRSDDEDWEDVIAMTPSNLIITNPENDSNDVTFERGDWNDLISEDPPSSTSPELLESEETETFLEEDEEWSEFDPQEDLDSTLTESRVAESSGILLDDEDWGEITEVSPPNLIVADLPTPQNIAEEDEDWGEFATEDSLDNDFSEGSETLTSEMSLEEDDDWDEAIAEEVTSPSPTEFNKISTSEISSEEDEDWGEFATEDALDDDFSEGSETLTSEMLLEEDDDWDEAIAEEVTSPSPTEFNKISTSEISSEEDWGDFATEDSLDEDLSEGSETSSSEIFPEEEDWGDFATEDSLDNDLSEGSETLTSEISSEEEEDWGDFATEDSLDDDFSEESETLTSEISSEEDDDWDEALAEEVASPSPTEFNEMSSSEIFSEEDWGEFATEDALDEDLSEESETSSSEIFSEEDWGEFATEEALDDDLSEESETSSSEISLEENDDWGEAIAENSRDENTVESWDIQGLDTSLQGDEDWIEPLVEESENAFESKSPNQLGETPETFANDWENETSEESLNSVEIESANLLPEAEFTDEDWGDFTEEELDSDPSVPDLRTVHFGAESELDEHEDWGEFTEEELDSEPSVPDLRAHFKEINQLDSEEEEEEEWEGFVGKEFDPEPAVFKEEDSEAAVPDFGTLDMGSDSEWEEFESLDPFMSPAESESSLTSIESEENWNDFSAEELEPYPNALDLTSDRELGSIEEDWEGTMLSRGGSDRVVAPPPLTAGEPERFDLEDLELDETDWENDPSSDLLFTDEELLEDTSVFQRQSSSQPPENRPRSQ